MGAPREDTTDQPALVMNPEYVAEEIREAWERVAASSVEPRMRRALFRVVTGDGYREAAEAEGYGDHAQVWRAARRYGLAAAKKGQILDRHRRVALLGATELERRLVDDPEAIATRDLTIMTGVSTDKVAAAEGWAKPAESKGGLRMDELLEQLAARGYTAKLELRPPDPAAQAVDVTATTEE